MHRRTRLRPVARSKQTERALYVKEARAFVAAARAAKTYCPVALALFGQRLLPTDVHHVRKRGRFLRDQSTWLAVSRRGHDWIEENKRDARARGWLAPITECG